jgi:hypothetical protein
MKNKTVIIRIFFSILITLYVLGIVTDTFSGLDLILQIFIGLLIFALIDTAAKFLPIGDIISKL